MTRRGGSRGVGATPATTRLIEAGARFVEHRYDHDPAVVSFGLEAAEALDVSPARVFKTLVLDLAAGGGRGLGVAVLPVDRHLDLKAAGAGLGVKKVALAAQAAAERATGSVVGGISPFGPRTPLPTVLDARALTHATIFVSGGRRGFDIEIAPSVVVALLGARTAPITR